MTCSQCGCREDGLLHGGGHHAGHGRERGRGGHLQLCEGAEGQEGQHGPDRGTTYTHVLHIYIYIYIYYILHIYIEVLHIYIHICFI